MKYTPGSIPSYEGEHLVLLPAGVTGEVTLEDGTVYDLGPAHQAVIEAQSHDHAKEIALQVSRQQENHDEAQSRKNLGLPKKKG